MHYPDEAQFERLATLGVTWAERAVLETRGHDRTYIADLINSLARWPLGTGPLRYYRLFHAYPYGARSLRQLDAPGRDILTAWRYLDTIPANLATAVGAGAWRLLPAIGDLGDALADLAREGKADAVRNPVIEQRITEATVLYAGTLTAARRDGRLSGAGYAMYGAPVPERLRRAALAWRTLGERQRASAVRRASLRRALS